MNQSLAPIDTPDIQEYRTRTDELVERAKSFSVSSPEDIEKSADILHNIKQIEQALIEKKEEITKPLMASLAATRNLFKPFEEAFDIAKKTIKRKILDYHEAEQARIDEEKARIVARVEKGTMRQDTAVQKLDSMEAPKKSVSGAVGSIQTRKITKVRIIDESVIPREYLVPDIQKITAAVLQGNVAVPGVEKYTETVIASR